MDTGPAIAAIDCGTNSTRLLVADANGQPLVRLMRITRLGQGVDATGRLAPEAIERCLAVLREFRGVMDVHGVGRGRLAATSAALDSASKAQVAPDRIQIHIRGQVFRHGTIHGGSLLGPWHGMRSMRLHARRLRDLGSQ